MRNGDPCRRPGRLSPYPSWLYDLHLVTAPHGKAQSGRPGSGVGVAIHCPYRRGAWEGAPTECDHRARLVPPHQSVGADVQTLLQSKGTQGPLTLVIPLLPTQSPKPPPCMGLLSRRWGGEMAARAHDDTL